MSFLGPTADPNRQRLIEVRHALLRLHKALIDSEREAYEREYGPVMSANYFLQMLISDDRFSWLRPFTSLVVDIDETLAAKRPATEVDLLRMLARANRLLRTPEDDPQFGVKYSAARERDLEVAVLHTEVISYF